MEMFKILVAVKRVIDYRVKVRVKMDGTGVESSQVPMSMNPFDEIAIEEAIRIAEKLPQKVEITLISIGPVQCQETLRAGLAMGADKAILVETEGEELEPFNIAKILAAICQQEQPHLVILGKQAIDDDSNQTGQMLAGFLDWPQGTFISKLELKDSKVVITREIDIGLQILELSLPAVLTTDLRLNEPRYSSLPNIMKSKQKPLQILPVKALNLDLHLHAKIMKVEPPIPRKRGIKVENFKELMYKLEIEEKVLS